MPDHEDERHPHRPGRIPDDAPVELNGRYLMSKRELDARVRVAHMRDLAGFAGVALDEGKMQRIIDESREPRQHVNPKGQKEPRHCNECGRGFETATTRRRFCTETCRVRNQQGQ